MIEVEKAVAGTTRILSKFIRQNSGGACHPIKMKLK
jgi:hypothetical protein